MNEYDALYLPKVSIIVATHNAAKTFRRCMLSILDQDFTNWELLIADGGSIDGTLGLIGEYRSHISWWQSEIDDGIYDAWNQSLAHARGEYVCFLGADDAWADRSALSMLMAAAEGTQYDLVTSQGIVFDPLSHKEVCFGSEWNYQRIGRRSVVCHPGMLHRRSLFERYGAFDPRYRIAGDLDFLLRLPRDVRTVHVNTVSVLVEGGGTSRKNVLARLREQREVLVRCERYGPVRAYLIWLDKLWRFPIARMFGISH